MKKTLILLITILLSALLGVMVGSKTLIYFEIEESNLYDPPRTFIFYCEKYIWGHKVEGRVGHCSALWK